MVSTFTTQGIRVAVQRGWAVLPLLAAMLVLPLAGDAAAASASTCDRHCLRALADRLLDSMAARDPSRLPLAQPYAATENSVPAALPMMSAWRSTTEMPAARRFYVLDAVSQQVFLIAGMVEGGSDTFLWGRLKVRDKQLAEIELYLNRSRAQGGYQLGAAGALNLPAAWTQPVGAQHIPPRTTLLRHGRAIFDTRGSHLPAAKDCVLMENGKVVEEHAEVAAEVAGTPASAPAIAVQGFVHIPCGMPPQRPTDAQARTEIVDEVQGIVVSQATVHGTAQPLIITTPTESAFVPDQILDPYLAMLRKQQASGRHGAPAIQPLAATAAVAEVHRIFDGQVQGQLLLVNLGAPGSRSAWLPR